MSVRGTNLPPVIVTDLDGTLLDAEHRLGDFTRDVLQALAKQGVHIVLASGRPWADVDAIRQRIGVDCYLITANGARVYAPGGRAVFARDLPPALTGELLSLATPGLRLNLYRDKDWLVTEPNLELLQYHKDSGFSYRVVEPAALPTSGVAKLFWIGDEQTLQGIEAEVMTLVGTLGEVTYSLPTSLEIMAAGVSKGAGLQAVLDELGNSRDEVLAFGDGLNDRDMLALAGQGVVTANANPALSEQDPSLEIIGSHTEESVARYLSELFL